MRIQNIQNTPIINYRAANSKPAMQKKNVNPMRSGLTTAGAWFGFGVALDLVSRKIQFSKSPMKNSLAVNGIIGGGAGIITGIMGIYKQSGKE